VLLVSDFSCYVLISLEIALKLSTIVDFLVSFLDFVMSFTEFCINLLHTQNVSRNSGSYS
jgi:hypothetical protein